MATRMPWGAPTSSDLTKLRPVLTGTRLASAAWFELLPQIRITEDFPNLAAWTVLDSGGNINVAGGIVTFQGSGVAWQNGIWRSLAAPRVLPAIIEFKVQIMNLGGGADVTWVAQHIGQYLPMTSLGVRNGCYIDPFNTRFVNRLQVSGPGDGSPNGFVALLALTNLDWMTVRLYVYPGGPGGFSTTVHRRIITIQDQHNFAAETILSDETGSGASYGDWYNLSTRVQFTAPPTT